MEFTLIGIIKKGKDNTRYLVSLETGGFASILLKTDLYQIGDQLTLENLEKRELNDIVFKETWIKKALGVNEYKRAIYEHLNQYKLRVLKIEEDGYWVNKDGEKQFYNHILPDNQIEKNLINSAYFDSIKRVYDQLKQKGEIHLGFKNLNSSQAFALNFFQPLIEENLLGEMFELGDIKKSCFEMKCKDDTQFDFFIESECCEVSFEVKYSEEGFGTARNDISHQNKWKELYEKDIKQIAPEISEDDFFSEYQLWRNILFTLNDKHKSFFLFPSFRKDLKETIEKTIEGTHLHKENVKIIFSDTICKNIINGNYPQKLKDHYIEFQKKYGDIKIK